MFDIKFYDLNIIFQLTLEHSVTPMRLVLNLHVYRDSGNTLLRFFLVILNVQRATVQIKIKQIAFCLFSGSLHIISIPGNP